MASIDIDKSNDELMAMDAKSRISFGVSHFGEHAVLLSSMQKTASILMHLLHELGLDNEIIFVDTGYHFHETLRFRDEFIKKYNLNIITLYPETTPEQQEEKFGLKLYKTVDGQPTCCDLRKGKPFIDYMLEQKHKLIFGGLRQAEGNSRKNTRAITLDPRIDGYKINPILDWTDDKIEEYISKNDIPVHPLHKLQYPSIGCECCTTPVKCGEEPRAGRWRHLRNDEYSGPAYCGINFNEGGGI